MLETTQKKRLSKPSQKTNLHAFCDVSEKGIKTWYSSVPGLESPHHHVVSARSGPLYVGRRARAAPRVGASRSAASWPGHGGPNGRSSATSAFGEQTATTDPATSPPSAGSWGGSRAPKSGRSACFAVPQQDVGRYSPPQICSRNLAWFLAC